MMGGWMGGGMGALMGMFFGFSWIFWLALLVLIIVAIIRLWPQPWGPSHGDDALSILRRRYANGEIDQEEFQRRRRDLLS